jgi:hypothetical protein
LNWPLRHEFILGANYQPTSLRLLAYSRRPGTWKKFSLGAIEAVSGKHVVADSNRDSDTQAGRIETFDAIVDGAGVPGLYQLYRLREQGLKERYVQDGSGVGGTWYWNRYPGCSFDSESETHAAVRSPKNCCGNGSRRSTIPVS